METAFEIALPPVQLQGESKYIPIESVFEGLPDETSGRLAASQALANPACIEYS